jgi:hypothetical protein
MERILAWPWGLRTKLAISAPGSGMSSVNRPRPVSSAGSSKRVTRAPKSFAPMLAGPPDSLNVPRLRAASIGCLIRQGKAGLLDAQGFDGTTEFPLPWRKRLGLPQLRGLRPKGPLDLLGIN